MSSGLVVQNDPANSSGGSAMNSVFSGNTTSGHLVVMCCGVNQGAIYDTPGGWNKDYTVNNGTLEYSVFSISADGTTMSTNWTTGVGNSGVKHGVMVEYNVAYADYAANSTSDTQNSAGSAVSSLAFGSVTGDDDGGIFIAGVYLGNASGGSEAATNGFTLIAAATATPRTFIFDDLIDPAGSTSTTVSWLTARTAVGMLVAYVDTSGAPAAAKPKTLMTLGVG